MSTVIANGFRGRFERVADLNATLTSFRDAARQRAVSIALTQIAQDAAYALDAYTVMGVRPTEVFPGVDSDRPLPAALDRYVARFRQTRQPDAVRDPAFDPDCTVRVLPDPDNDGDVYFLLNTEVPRHLDTFAQLPGIQPFSYWDNIDDIPEGVTWDAWKRRGQVWDRLLDKRAVGDVGFSLDVCGGRFEREVTFLARDHDQIADHVPKIENRALRLGQRKASEAIAERYRQEHGQLPSMNAWMDLMLDHTDEIQREVREQARQLRDKLPVALTHTDLEADLGAPAPGYT